MKTPSAKSTSLVGTAVALLAASPNAVPAESVDAWIAQVADKNDQVRGPAWQRAEQFGAVAVKPLAAVMASADFEVARAAKRALWRLVRHAGRPKAAGDQQAVAAELLALLGAGPVSVRCELLSMLSEIGNDDAVNPLAVLLTDPELRESARCALQRLPGRQATAALKRALTTVPTEFRPAIAESLRSRRVRVKGYPSQKRVPSRLTEVKAVAVAQ